MLQYPINVKPENYAIDADKNNAIQFTFNGDKLWGIANRIYDYNTGKIVVSWFDGGSAQTNTPRAYNGDTVYQDLEACKLKNGKDYILQMMFTQRKADGAPVYDMPVVGGSIYEHSGQKNIYVASNMTSIYPWGHDGSGYYYPTKINGEVFAGAIIKIGNESRFIERYSANGTRGSIWVSEAFETEFKGGEKYQIYSNYIITPQYFFSCRSMPTIDFSYSAKAESLKCEGVYTQEEDSAIKYYVLKLYWANNSGFWNETGDSPNKSALVEETGKIYSQHISYEFRRPYRHNEKFPDLTTDYYKVVAEVVTQDNFTCSIESDVLAIEAYNTEHTDYLLKSFGLSWDKENGRVIYKLNGYGSSGYGVMGNYEIFREDLNSGEVVRLEDNAIGFEYDEETEEYSIRVGCDITASTHGNYRYKIFKFNNNGKAIISSSAEFPVGDIETNEYAYYISDLNEYDVYQSSISGNHTNKKFYNLGDTWRFMTDISDTTVINNLDRQTYSGYSQYVTSLSTNVNYMSGTLTGMFGKLDCATKTFTDNIALIQAWRKFITQKKPFLLKSQKGDVWIVNVVENPTTTYQENVRGVPTTFSFSWAEVCDIDDVEIMVYGYGT